MFEGLTLIDKVRGALADKSRLASCATRLAGNITLESLHVPGIVHHVLLDIIRAARERYSIRDDVLDA